MVRVEEQNKETIAGEALDSEAVDGVETGASSGKGDSEESSVIIAKKDAEIAQLKEQVLRGRADFDNFRKRCVKNEELNKKLAVRDFAIDIITIHDNLIRASDAALHIKDGESLDQAHRAYVEGVIMISKSIENVLGKNGIEEIDSLNCPFNPVYHEAIEFDTSADVSDDTVTKVHQKGFKIDTFVIRTAKVKVTKPEKRSEQPAQKENNED
ncbi:MAG TPA: nucleotide exchange factor GrpE [Spirochaetota bacterium]